MQLTTTGKILVGLVIAALLGFSYYKFAPEKGQIAETESTYKAPEPSTSESPASSSASADNNASSDNAAMASSSATFDYTAPAPVDGKLKGVVELGASGFNSFIVNIDKQKN